MTLRRSSGGFSLLEVMVSVAIMALAVVVILEITTSNVRAAHHARLLTVATFLARAKLALIEDQILEAGFVDADEEDEGDFADEGYPQVRWQSLIEKIELPTDAIAKAQEAGAEAAGTSSSPMTALAGLLGGFMTSLVEPIRVGLEESVRRVTMRVLWAEVGRGEQQFEVVTFMTDPAKLDLALPAGAATAGAAGAGRTGQTGGAPPAGGAGAATGASGAPANPLRTRSGVFGGWLRP